MSDHELKLLYQVLKTSEKGLLNSLPRILERYFHASAIHATKDYIYVEGDIPVALIAHLDTVHRSPPQVIFQDKEANVIWSPHGLGADDRAGVYSILHILEDGYRPTIIFTTGEETGAHGAIQLITDYVVPISELNFLIELDRQGRDEAVYYDCGNVDFEHFIDSFDFTTDFGTFSDIAIIGPEWDIASVNLSIGYYNEHTLGEHLHYDYMKETIKKVERILENCGNTKFDYQEIQYPNELGYIYNWVPFVSPEGQTKCDCCDRVYSASALTYAEDDEGYRWRLCPDCVSKHTDACPECGVLMINMNHAIKDKRCFCCAMEDKYGRTYGVAAKSRNSN